MKASIHFLGNGKGFNSKEIEGYGHGFLIAAHISQKLHYILYASHKHPGHSELMEYFLKHYSRFQILGGGSIVRNKGLLKMYPLTSSIGYIPMSVSHAIIPHLQNKLQGIGITDTIQIESHEDQIKEVIKKLSKNWKHHVDNFN